MSRFWCVIVILFAAFSEAGSLVSRGVVTQLHGQVTVSDSEKVSYRPVRLDTVLREGVTVHVPKNAHVGVVCANDRLVRLGPGRHELFREACAEGKPLTVGTFHAVLPRSDSVRQEVLEQITRGDEGDPLTPLLLAPRETNVTQARPEIRWTRVEDAVEYEVELSNSEPWMRRYAAEELPCPEQTFLGKRYEICSVPWPDDVPDLEPGAAVFLSVGARPGFAVPLRTTDPSRIVRLSRAEVEEAHRMRWTLLRALGSEAEGRRLESRLYRNRGLHQCAAAVFEGVATSELGVEDRLEMAELALEIDLPERARELAQKVFHDTTKLDLQARALELQALADVLQQRTRQARVTLARALTLYRRAELTEPASVAESMLRTLEGK